MWVPSPGVNQGCPKTVAHCSYYLPELDGTSALYITLVLAGQGPPSWLLFMVLDSCHVGCWLGVHQQYYTTTTM